MSFLDMLADLHSFKYVVWADGVADSTLNAFVLIKFDDVVPLEVDLFGERQGVLGALQDAVAASLAYVVVLRHADVLFFRLGHASPPLGLMCRPNEILFSLVRSCLLVFFRSQSNFTRRYR